MIKRIIKYSTICVGNFSHNAVTERGVEDQCIILGYHNS